MVKFFLSKLVTTGSGVSYSSVVRLIFFISVFICISIAQAVGQCIKLDIYHGYNQKFNDDNGNWVPGGVNSDWVWGKPSKKMISTTASEDKCWVIGGLTGNKYNINQKSSLAVGCFDFTNIPYPYVQFDIFWETNNNSDGASFQYSTDGGVTWHNVGAVGDEMNCWVKNWFNNTSISSLAGFATVTEGWSGNIQPDAGVCLGGDGSGKWVTARHDLFNLAGKKNILLRFVFGSGSSCNSYDGFAVDNFSIGYHESKPVITYLEFTSPMCHGVEDNPAYGTSVANAPEYTGVGDRTYKWTNGNVHFEGPHQYKLPAGDYTVTAIDANNCTSDARKFTIIEPPALTHTVTIKDASCNGTGTAIIHERGGVPITGESVRPYTYKWLTAELITDSIGTGLKPGGYQVHVRDKNNCLDVVEFTIGSNAPVSINKTNVSCFGVKDGSATATFDGTPPFQYSWSTGGTSATADNLAAGAYTVKVTDATGCSGSGKVQITEPAAITTKITNVIQPTCGNPNGEATVSASGGTGTFTYLWSHDNSTDAYLTGLAAGTYSVIVTDGNGCKKPDGVTINPSSSPQITAIGKTDVLCNGGNTGTATATVVNGTLPYTFKWEKGSTVYTINPLTDVDAGEYTLTVTDAANCKVTGKITITEPAAITTKITNVIQPTCGNPNGEATVSASGGTGTYTYLWSHDNSTGAHTTGLAAGTYSVMVTDGNGCKKPDRVTINPSSAPQITAIGKTDVLCNGGNTGTATATIVNGTLPYTFKWEKGSTVYTINPLIDVGAGEYTFTVTDAANCMVTGKVTITEPAAIITKITNVKQPTCGNLNGEATVSAIGGTGTYTYLWSHDNSTNAQISGLAAGTYSVIVSDENGCKKSDGVTINPSSAPQITAIGKTDVLCNGGNTGTATATVVNGTLPYTFDWKKGGKVYTINPLKDVEAGEYILTVTDGTNCTATDKITIKEPNPLNTSVTQNISNCNSNNGNATVFASGGTSPYTYSWTPGNQTTSSITNLSEGKYLVIVTDHQGCQKVDSAFITTTKNLVISSVTAKDVLCYGQQNGVATATVTGGTPPYDYSWTNGTENFTGAVIKNAGQGNYILSVTDASGCKATASVAIAGPKRLELSVLTTATKCGSNNGSASAVISGGTAPYKYAWSSGSRSDVATKLQPGIHSLIVTDANNCTVSASQIKIHPSVALKINLGKDTVICPGMKVVLTPGNFKSYTWQDNSHAPLYEVVKTGTYAVTVTDISGCTASATKKVDVHCQDIVFPSGFTPNDDRQNDLFGPLGTLSAVSNYSLRIFNRWGQVIFSSNNPYQKWDGKCKGKDPGTGTFIWMADYSFNGEVKRLQKGTVVLIK